MSDTVVATAVRIASDGADPDRATIQTDAARRFGDFRFAWHYRGNPIPAHAGRYASLIHSRSTKSSRRMGLR